MDVGTVCHSSCVPSAVQGHRLGGDKKVRTHPGRGFYISASTPLSSPTRAAADAYFTDKAQGELSVFVRLCLHPDLVAPLSSQGLQERLAEP